jgi:hypothetical protein
MAARSTHGLSRTRTYRLWSGIKNRCASTHPYYGGRGITLCDRWQSFVNFFEDVGEIPAGMSVDRIDSDRPYEPGNVRLLDAKGQARNRRTNHLVTIDGQTKPLAEWQEQYGLPANTLINRINAGMTGADLIAPSNAHKERILTYRGVSRSLTQWARAVGITKDCLGKRLRYGWPLSRALTTKGDARYERGHRRKNRKNGPANGQTTFV